jgi:hypothetical protein
MQPVDTRYHLRRARLWLIVLVVGLVLSGVTAFPLVTEARLIACAGIIPLALICGPIRGIPFFWTCVDMCFGLFGVVPLVLAYRHIRMLALAHCGVTQRIAVPVASS